MNVLAHVEYVRKDGSDVADVYDEDALRTELVIGTGRYGLLDLVILPVYTYALYGHIEDV